MFGLFRFSLEKDVNMAVNMKWKRDFFHCNIYIMIGVFLDIG